MTLVNTLESTELFGGLEAGHLGKVADMCRGTSHRKGETIFKEGDEAKELYILMDGRVVLEMEVCPVPDRPSIPTAVEVVTEGETLGWSALVEPYVYTLSARCVANCRVLTINGDMLRRVMTDDTILGYELMKRLAKIISLRLAYTRLRLTSGLGLVLLARQMKASE